MRFPFVKLKNIFEYATIRFCHAFIMALPWRAMRDIGIFLGDLLCLADAGKRHERTVSNLMMAFPALSSAEAAHMKREVYRNLVCNLLASLSFMRFIPQGKFMRDISLKGVDKLKQTPSGRGIIFVGGHFGCWEMLGAVLTTLGYPVAAIARRRSNPYLGQYVKKLREKGYATVVPKRGGMTDVIRLLREGFNLGLLIDQDARHDGIFVDFFNRSAATFNSAARLSIATGAPIAVVYGLKAGDGLQFEVGVRDVIWPKDVSRREYADEVYRMTQKFTHVLENLVREHPTQWLWLHKRWKTYPGKYPKE